MTHDKDNHGIDELEVLTQRYREHSAPPGFASRVSAISQERNKRRYWQSPLWLGASFATAIIALLLVLPLYYVGNGLEPLDEPAPQVAVEPKQQYTAVPDKQVATLDESTKRDRDNQVDNVDKVVVTVAASDSEFDMGNLSDAASWMASQEAPEMPDFSNIPSPVGMLDLLSNNRYSATHYVLLHMQQNKDIQYDMKESNDETA